LNDASNSETNYFKFIHVNVEVNNIIRGWLRKKKIQVSHRLRSLELLYKKTNHIIFEYMKKELIGVLNIDW